MRIKLVTNWTRKWAELRTLQHSPSHCPGSMPRIIFPASIFSLSLTSIFCHLLHSSFESYFLLFCILFHFILLPPSHCPVQCSLPRCHAPDSFSCLYTLPFTHLSFLSSLAFPVKNYFLLFCIRFRFISLPPSCFLSRNLLLPQMAAPS